MGDLKDYSGEFRPNTKLEDFSKDALIRLLNAYAKVYVGVTSYYHSAIVERLGPEEAWKIDTDVYLKQQHQFEMPLISKAMNIQGNDVLTMAKLTQVLPDGIREGIVEAFWDIKNNNHAILTITKCQVLSYYERHGTTKDIERLCGPGSLEHQCFTAYGKWANPNIETRILKIPPRKTKDDICCIWEFELKG